jgi:23S rRNA (adenine-N6)-dimethyltransferase
MRNTIKYSQNFLQNQALVKKLVDMSDIGKDDVVYEIGAGLGIITEELLKKAGKVVAFELDQNLFAKLQQKFSGEKSLELNPEDFMSSILPKSSFKVFSNIPFNITAAIIKKLTFENYPPLECFLIVQSEAAKKFAGKPMDNKNSQMAVLLYPWFSFDVIYKFNRSDFSPKPNVDIVLLRISKRFNPLISKEFRDSYNDFVVYLFNQFNPNISESLNGIFGVEQTAKIIKQIGFDKKSKPSDLNAENWIDLFEAFLDIAKDKQELVKNSFRKQLKQQESVQKINRTRVDKNWRKF